MAILELVLIGGVQDPLALTVIAVVVGSFVRWLLNNLFSALIAPLLRRNIHER